jgi:hypothetical protein
MARAKTTRQALESWDDYRQQIERETPVPLETPAAKSARIKRLEKDPEAWFAYHFPHYASAPAAPFHRRATRRLLANPRHYGARAWCRGLAKSTRAMMELLYLILVKKRYRNVLMISHSETNAIDLLAPYQINLEGNQRLINDYGRQKGYRNWQLGNFVTKQGVSFRGLGGGQSPRGTKNEFARPDVLLFDDLDNDELCRNPTRVRQRWDWVEQAAIPTVDISADYLILFLNNLIAKDSIMSRAMEMADHSEKINIRDDEGRSTWPEKNSEKDIDDMLDKLSYRSKQKEYFNNPITEGTVFESLTWDRVPPLSRFRYLVGYGDPSYKNSRKADFKALPLIGELGGKFYVVRAYCAQATIAKMIDWYYDHHTLVGQKAGLYQYIEAGSLQDTFYEELFLPRLIEQGESRGHLSISPDHRSKPDKFTRIEATLEPLNRQGRLIFNKAERTNPHMQALAAQMLAIAPNLPGHDDGPDALEGAVWKIQNKLRTYSVTAGTHRRRSKKY